MLRRAQYFQELFDQAEGRNGCLSRSQGSSRNRSQEFNSSDARVVCDCFRISRCSDGLRSCPVRLTNGPAAGTGARSGEADREWEASRLCGKMPRRSLFSLARTKFAAFSCIIHRHEIRPVRTPRRCRGTTGSAEGHTLNSRGERGPVHQAWLGCVWHGAGPSRLAGPGRRGLHHSHPPSPDAIPARTCDPASNRSGGAVQTVRTPHGSVPPSIPTSATTEDAIGLGRTESAGRSFRWSCPARIGVCRTRSRRPDGSSKAPGCADDRRYRSCLPPALIDRWSRPAIETARLGQSRADLPRRMDGADEIHTGISCRGKRNRGLPRA